MGKTRFPPIFNEKKNPHVVILFKRNNSHGNHLRPLIFYQPKRATSFLFLPSPACYKRISKRWNCSAQHWHFMEQQKESCSLKVQGVATFLWVDKIDTHIYIKESAENMTRFHPGSGVPLLRSSCHLNRVTQTFSLLCVIAYSNKKLIMIETLWDNRGELVNLFSLSPVRSVSV